MQISNAGASALLSNIVKTESEIDTDYNLRQRRGSGFITDMVPIPRFEKQPTKPAIYKLKIKSKLVLKLRLTRLNV